MHARRFALASMALMVTAAACGGGSDDPAETTVKASTTTLEPTTTTVDLTDDYVDAFIESSFEDLPPGVSRSDVRCAAEGMVAAITPERLQELGIEPDDIEDSEDFGDFDQLPARRELRAMVDAMLECIDFAPVFAESFAEEFGPTTGGDVTDQVIECIETVLLDADVIADVMTEELRGGDVDELMDPLLGDFLACIDWSAVMGAVFAQQLGEPLSDETLSCFDETIDNDAVSAKLREVYDETGDTEAVTEALVSEILPSVIECISPEDQEKIENARP